ncbi:MAG: hypothetical protein ABIJ09_02105 [Pseudomonadota bacterium]
MNCLAIDHPGYARLGIRLGLRRCSRRGDRQSLGGQAGVVLVG